MNKHSVWVKSMIVGGLLLLPACAGGERQASPTAGEPQTGAAVKQTSSQEKEGAARKSNGEHAPLLDDFDALMQLSLTDEDREQFPAYFMKTREAVKLLDATLTEIHSPSQAAEQFDFDRIKADFLNVQTVFDANPVPRLNSFADYEDLTELHEKIRSAAVLGQQLTEAAAEAEKSDDPDTVAWLAEVNGRIEEALERSRVLLGQLKERSREAYQEDRPKGQESGSLQAELNKTSKADMRKLDDYMARYGALMEQLMPLGIRLREAFTVLQGGEGDVNQMYEEWTAIHASFEKLSGEFGKLSVPQVGSAMLNEKFSDMHSHTQSAFSYGEQGSALIVEALETGDQSKLDQAVDLFDRMSEESEQVTKSSKDFANLGN
ncbi:hypothetical protein [Saccharibacillus alkalitolerans]|uniref:DUF3829 domain-containing protein n=1 Tax=Saccharibacillus alkalitolerans TaxID=2705290 RepID=A0ABX0F7P5_9BACL|nr:hypothetical protein [Saccharibacillus alkalitolerans]NGZ76981.1 hypothetical protein [Saccharibacillus alkalitolerans]